MTTPRRPAADVARDNPYRDAGVLITGGLGFIGSNLARRLVVLGARVRILDSLVPEHGGCRFNIHDIEDAVTLTLGDIGDTDQVRQLAQGQHFLFNLAGQSSHWDSMVNPCRDLDINCGAHLRLLECLRQCNPQIRMVYAGTRQIYGKPEYLPVDEAHPLRPVDINGIHKIAGESYHTLYDRLYGMRCAILRLTNTVGPGMRIKDDRQTFFGLWLRRAMEGKPFEVWGGEQLRDFNYIDDVVDAFLLAAGSDKARGRIYNLGASPPVSLRQLADLLASVARCPYTVTSFPEERKTIDIGDYYASYERIKADLGWQPRTPLNAAVEATVAYYRQHWRRYR
jgi:nucleoside-diphosphate-sugar epimerase